MNILRALTWKQPYASLMLYGKWETRNRPTKIRGSVLICVGKKSYPYSTILQISGSYQEDRILKKLPKDYEKLNSQAIAIGNLTDCRPMFQEDADKCFVRYRPGLWVWLFEDIRAIKPFPYKGSQGWSFVPDEVKSKIEFI